MADPDDKQPDDKRSDESPPGLGRNLLSGLLAAAFVGLFWGAIESFGRVLLYRYGDFEGIRDTPDVGWIDGAAIVVLSGLEYAVLGAIVGLLSILVLVPILSVLFARKGLDWRLFVAPRFSIITVAVFFNLFWFTRYFIGFAFSERFYSPKRLMLSAFLFLVAMASAALIVRWRLVTRGVSPRVRVGALALVVIVSATFLVRERSLLDDQPDLEDATGRYNVVLFVLDALRADRVGCYGYERNTTPKIDRIARESVVFERAVVQAPYTWTSFGSMMTGKYPRKHGLLKMDPTVKFNPKQNVTLQRILDANGYRTSAFLTGMLSNSSGLIDGFQTYFESMIGRDPVRRDSVWSYFRSELILRRAMNKVRQAFDPSLVADEAVDWVTANRQSRFFTMVHLYSTHTPYDPPREYDVFSPDYTGPFDKFTHSHAELLHLGKAQTTPADLQRIGDLYDGGLLFADAMTGGVYEALARLDLLDDTIIVITSDHGEELGEHGLWEHNWMYNTNQLVPLIIRFPDGVGAGHRVAGPVEHVDLLPTLLEVLELEAPEVDDKEVINGESLMPFVRGERSSTLEEFAFCENIYYISVQNRDWKLIRSREPLPEDPPRLYHLAEDPYEMEDLYEFAPPMLDVLTRVLDEYDAEQEKDRPFVETSPLNTMTLQILNQGGYIGGVSIREGQYEKERNKRGGSDGDE